jgi:2-polyprenyl-3-methyl-5-hydroxy-6-metoxy-1,4-benzoquinol methylase
MSSVIDNRVHNEIAHAKFLIAHDAGEIWNWETPSGKLRWRRRAKMLMSAIAPGQSVLEIGCGAGYLTKELAKTSAVVTAIDISLDFVRSAKNSIQSSEIRYSTSNAYMLSFNDRTFDSIIGSSVLHHLDVEKALREFYRVLRPGGKLVFTEPNMLNPHIMLQKNVPFIKKACGDSPDETAFFAWQLKRKLVKFGFTEISIAPFDFLHPKIPTWLLPVFKPLCAALERVPVVREIAGSLFIQAWRP